MTCTVRNLSATGALLQAESFLGVPPTFTLAFDDGSPSRECVVRWTSLALLGVKFK